MRTTLTNSIALAVLVWVGTAASAATITFSPLTGSQGDAYTGHVEAGFQITAAGSWQEDHQLGDPAPAIFSTARTDSISVFGGLFTFGGVDLACEGGAFDHCIVSVQAFLGGDFAYGVGGVMPAGPTPFFLNVGGGSTAGIVIDELTITMSRRRGATQMNIDNIVANAIPEPSAALSFGVGVWLVGSTLRRRNV